MPFPSGYPYVHKLLQLDSCRPISTQPPYLPAALLEITTPLISRVWERELATHPDQKFARYVTQGIKQGFRVGFNHVAPLISSSSNMSSALEHPQVVSDYLQQEVTLNRMLVVPAADLPLIHCHISPFGVIPKRSKPGKWRLIVDLSSPSNASVNDGISRDMCSVTYTTIDRIANHILELGRGALMAKADIKQAYRIIPVHPEDRHLLAVQWDNTVMLDKVLPFGLRSAPLIFTAVADGLQWIMLKRGVSMVTHYLDDYITLGPPESSECEQNLAEIIKTCEYTGTPLEAEKCEGPTPVLTFLGMELDSLLMEVRLPQDKLIRLKQLLADWSCRKAGKKRDLLSLIGYLQHASKAVRQGRSFLRRLINLSMTAKQLDRMLRLNRSARSDIQWWRAFADQWNGTSMLTQFDKTHPQVFVTSDASGSWGCGAYEGPNWLQYQWPATMETCHIAIKEMIPVVFAAALWGRTWSTKSVRFQSDNSAVVALVNNGSSMDDYLMHLMRCLAFIMAKYNFVVSATHVRGVDNKLADALSRNKLTEFLSNYPQAQLAATRVPPELVELLLLSKPDWTSPAWTKLWTAIFGQP